MSGHFILRRYVVEKDVQNNVVFVSRNYYSLDKRRRTFRVGSLNWFSDSGQHYRAPPRTPRQGNLLVTLHRWPSSCDRESYGHGRGCREEFPCCNLQWYFRCSVQDVSGHCPFLSYSVLDEKSEMTILLYYSIRTNV